MCICLPTIRFVFVDSSCSTTMAVWANPSPRVGEGKGLATQTTEAKTWHRWFVLSYQQPHRRFRPITPATIARIQRSLVASQDSSKKNIPTAEMHAVPNAAHTAYAVLTSICGRLKANPNKLRIGKTQKNKQETSNSEIQVETKGTGRWVGLEKAARLVSQSSKAGTIKNRNQNLIVPRVVQAESSHHQERI